MLGHRSVSASSTTRQVLQLTVQVLTLKSTLISLQSLLCDPVPNDPQDAEGQLCLPPSLCKVLS